MSAAEQKQKKQRGFVKFNWSQTAFLLISFPEKPLISAKRSHAPSHQPLEVGPLFFVRVHDAQDRFHRSAPEQVSG